MCDNSTIEFADKLLVKMPICYSNNQVEILQNLGNYTFAAQFEADDFLQKIINLLKKPDATKINCLPAPLRKKLKCFSLDTDNFLFMDERLNIPKALCPIILSRQSALRTPGQRQYAGDGGKCVVATAPPKSGGNCSNVPSV